MKPSKPLWWELFSNSSETKIGWALIQTTAALQTVVVALLIFTMAMRRWGHNKKVFVDRYYFQSRSEQLKLCFISSCKSSSSWHSIITNLATTHLITHRIDDLPTTTTTNKSIYWYVAPLISQHTAAQTYMVEWSDSMGHTVHRGGM
jgi:hypothetical protein